MFGLRLVEHAAQDFHRLWSIRASLAYGAFATAAGALSWFADTVNPWLLVGVAVVLNVVVLPVLRLIKQREAPPATLEPEDAA